MENDIKYDYEQYKNFFRHYLTKIHVYDIHNVVALKSDVKKIFYIITSRRQVVTLNPNYDPNSERPFISDIHDKRTLNLDLFPIKHNLHTWTDSTWNKYFYKEELELIPLVDYFVGNKNSFYVDCEKVSLILVDEKSFEELLVMKKDHDLVKDKYENSLYAINKKIEEVLNHAENLILR